MKIACLYCTQCAEQITNIVRKKFKIKSIELGIRDQVVTISSNVNIQKDKLAKEIGKRGYGPVVFITKSKNVV